MKLYKHIASMLIFSMLTIIFVGCESEESYYQFRQDLQNVVTVSVCSYDLGTGTCTKIIDLNTEDRTALINILSTMKCKRYFPGDHPRDYGPLVITLTYADEEIELIGLTNIGWITPDGKRWLSDFYFEEREVYDLICKFVDLSLLPDIYLE